MSDILYFIAKTDAGILILGTIDKEIGIFSVTHAMWDPNITRTDKFGDNVYNKYTSIDNIDNEIINRISRTGFIQHMLKCRIKDPKLLTVEDYYLNLL